MSATFQQDARTPEWAEGVNDGTIASPSWAGPSQPAAHQVLRHELAHSFIAARTGGNCPTWLQEGVSQWLEGGDPARDDAAVARATREGRLMPLLTLEAPFQSLPPFELQLAYAEACPRWPTSCASAARQGSSACWPRCPTGYRRRRPCPWPWP
jgi:hypothetical protein